MELLSQVLLSLLSIKFCFLFWFPKYSSFWCTSRHCLLLWLTCTHIQLAETESKKKRVREKEKRKTVRFWPIIKEHQFYWMERKISILGLVPIGSYCQCGIPWKMGYKRLDKTKNKNGTFSLPSLSITIPFSTHQDRIFLYLSLTLPHFTC